MEEADGSVEQGIAPAKTLEGNSEALTKKERLRHPMAMASASLTLKSGFNATPAS